ncbi:MAG: hypothetical protein Ct9H90mP22_3030 [Gammaproteobacteria bacterium]|nr:MAG: hypothetical protein Ct9H90mP22_3030 [Gammaproteobacteria bacterium]
MVLLEKIVIQILNRHPELYPIKTYLNVDLQQTGCCLIFLTPDKEGKMAACPGASSQLTLANFNDLETID